MDSLFFEPLRLRGSLSRDTNRHNVHGDHILGDVKELPQRGNAFLIRVNATPGAAVAEGRGGEEDVLCGRRAVLDPVAGDLLEGGLGADDDGEARVLREGAVGVDLRNLGESLLVADHDEVPGLGVDGARGVHPGSDDLADVFVGNLFGGVEVAGGTTGLDDVLDEFGHFIMWWW